VDNCPKDVLALGSTINAQGYNYVYQKNPDKCVLCDICGIVCPDVAIGVVVE
jgi:2-oxoglutarate ferredoxin oxidoreductase subunit delta